MDLIYWLLLITSAILYAVPFFCIDKLWWLIFAFPLPLFWVCIQQNVGFIHGYIWGFMLFGIHFIGVFPYLRTLSDSSIILQHIPIVCIMIYLPLISGLFFSATQFIINFFGWQKTLSYTLPLWILCLYKYLYALENFSLFIFGRAEGYALLNPLIVLTEYPPLLSLLPLLGKLTFLLAFISTAASIVWVLVTRTPRSCIPLIGLILFWILNITQYPQAEPKPVWLDTIVGLPHTFTNTESPFKARNEALYLVKQLLKAFPQAMIVITPESAFYSDQLNNIDMHQIFNHQELGREAYLVMGAFRRDTDNYYNCINVIHDGLIKNSFDKRHAMLLTERLPGFLDTPYWRKSYFAQTQPISIGTHSRPLLEFNKQISLVPYICSELFFNEEPDDFYPFTTILAVCNDRWCWKYFADIMYHTAKLKAISWQRPIIYNTFYHQSYCSPTGQHLPLNTHNPA